MMNKLSTDFVPETIANGKKLQRDLDGVSLLR